MLRNHDKKFKKTNIVYIVLIQKMSEVGTV